MVLAPTSDLPVETLDHKLVGGHSMLISKLPDTFQELLDARFRGFEEIEIVLKPLLRLDGDKVLNMRREKFLAMGNKSL